MFETLPQSHTACCSIRHTRCQGLHSPAPKRLRSWQTKLDCKPRKYRCACSNDKPPAGTPPDSDPQEHNSPTSEPTSSASSDPEVERKRAEVHEVLKKAIRGAPGGSARKKLPLQYIWKKDLAKLGQALPFTLGIPGSIAVLAGYYLHIDPYGHLHWSTPDALTGLACAVPVALTDACLLLPDISDKKSALTFVSKKNDSSADASRHNESRPQASSSTSTATESQQGDQKAASAEQIVALSTALLQLGSEQQTATKAEVSKPADQADKKEQSSNDTRPSLARHTDEKQAGSSSQAGLLDMLGKPKPLSLQGAISSWQRETVTANPWLQSMPVTEGVSIVLRQLPWMMLSRGILQSGLAGWLTDRFYQAGADDVMTLVGSQPIPTSEAAQWTALAVMVGLYTGAALYTPQGRIRLIDARSRQKQPVMGKDRLELAKKKERIMKQIQQTVAQRQQAQSAITCVRLAAANIAYGSSYILTGNLLAPYISSVTCKALFSFEQRVKHQQWNSDFKEKLELLLERSTAAAKADL